MQNLPKITKIVDSSPVDVDFKEAPAGPSKGEPTPQEIIRTLIDYSRNQMSLGKSDSEIVLAIVGMGANLDVANMIVSEAKKAI